MRKSFTNASGPHHERKPHILHILRSPTATNSIAAVLECTRFVVLPYLFALSFVSIAQAQDQIVLGQADSSSRVTISGEIVDYTRDTIEFRTSTSKRARQYAASQVVEIKTYYAPKYQAAREALDRRDLQQARLLWKQALEAEPRGWMRRQILAQLTRLELMEDDETEAALYFVTMLQSHPRTRHFELIPLPWSDHTVAAERLGPAGLWLRSPIDAVQLLAAATLLFDQRYQEQATEKLKDLTRSTDEDVRALANCQLWRLAPNADSLRLKRWKRQAGNLPDHVKAGPYYYLARQFSKSGDPIQALALHLWVSLVHSGNPSLASRAGFEAARIQETTGQRREASVLYNDVIARYPWNTSTRSARERLFQIAPN